MNKGLKKGFTLIELLIVIVIIGILSGVVLSILRPDLAQRRAKEAVLRSNMEKACLGLKACGISVGQGGASKCDTADELGIDTGNLSGKPDANTKYCLAKTASSSDCTTENITSTTLGATGTETISITGSRLVSGSNYCTMSCSYDFNATTGTVTTEVNPGADADCAIR
jgi:prepilin-type N-terminal cleavage/methylation domain-containing protein